MKSVILDGGGAVPKGKHVLGMKPGKSIFGTVKVGDRGQIVIPKEARERFGIEPGSTLLVLGDDKSGIIITRPEVISHVASRILDSMDEENGRDKEEAEEND